MERSEIARALRRTLSLWTTVNIPRLAASFSFYAVLSLAPLLVLAVVVAGIYYGDVKAELRILREVKNALGAPSADLIKRLIENSQHGAAVATSLSLAVTLFGAAGLFEQLRDAECLIWGARPHIPSGFKGVLVGKGIAMLVSIVFLFALGFWLVLDSVVLAVARDAGLHSLYLPLSMVAATVFLALVFAARLKFGVGRDVPYRRLLIPASITGLMVALGKLFIGYYFALAGFASAYGSASSLVIVLLWIYIASQIYFGGVALAKVLYGGDHPDVMYS